MKALSLSILALSSLGACRALVVDSENRPRRGRFLPDSPPHGCSMGQEAGKKGAGAVDLQPTIPKSDRFLGDCRAAAAPDANLAALSCLTADDDIQSGKHAEAAAKLDAVLSEKQPSLLAMNLLSANLDLQKAVEPVLKLRHKFPIEAAVTLEIEVLFDEQRGQATRQTRNLTCSGLSQWVSVIGSDNACIHGTSQVLRSVQQRIQG